MMRMFQTPLSEESDKAGYSPPEQYAADGRLHGPCSHLYALGATLYRAVTGRVLEEPTLRRESALYLPCGRRRLPRRGLHESLAVGRAPAADAAGCGATGRAGLARALNVALPQGNARARRASAPAALAMVVVLGDAFGSGEERPQPLAPPRTNPGAEAAWAAVKDSTSIAGLEAFIAHSPGSFYSDLARAHIAELKNQQVAAECDGVRAMVGNEGRCLKAKDTFKDCADCPEMVVVPTGGFMMGSPNSEERRFFFEGPQHNVTIAKPFAVSKFEATFAEWDACVAAGGCKHKPDDHGWGRGKRPVINVAWDDISREYLPWLSDKTRKTYRLLTEAEWEYAARAGTTTPFSTGWTITTDEANFNGDFTYGGIAKGQYRQRTVEVGSFKPNPFGLYDMHGNVWEWIEDCFNYSYEGAPADGSAWTTGDCGKRMLRGGGWGEGPLLLRSAFRIGDRPVSRGDGSGFLGFRLARTL